MRFGPVPVADAEGCLSAHAVRADGVTLKKGQVIERRHIEALQAKGVASLVAVRLELGDIGEDEAAARIAAQVGGANVRAEEAFTGRANIFATHAGVLLLDEPAIEALNSVDEAITLATLPPFRAVIAGEMVATVKIIPFAVTAAALTAALAAAPRTPVRVAAYRPLRVGVISTVLPGLKPATIDKTLRVLESRLDPAGARIAAELRVPHETAMVAAAISRVAQACDLVVVYGASAITDRRDVIPSALCAAGGRIDHFGMPVDPGNLLLLGRLADDKPVLGAPGCARSPKENGFDWVLQRLLADVPVDAAAIRRMGLGGLLMEIGSRPQPRAGAELGHVSTVVGVLHDE